MPSPGLLGSHHRPFPARSSQIHNALCTSCSRVTVRALTSDIGELPSWWDRCAKPIRPRGMQHLPDARDLPRSAARCPLCALIRAAILQYCAGLKFPRKPEDSHVGCGREWCGVDFEQHLTEEPIYLHPKRDAQGRAFPEENIEKAWCLTGIAISVPVAGDVLAALLRLYALPGSAPARSGDIIGRPDLPSPNCPPAVDLINRWIGTCTREHDKCRETFSGSIVDDASEQELPSRIIDVGSCDGSQDPKLIETQGVRGHYVSLSHCWGSPEKPPLTTTRESLQDRLRGIPWDTLPRTYQDAIEATRGMRMRYIWIDSLCIVQDCRADWLKESRKMGLVYERARVTIAASHSSDTHQGCFLKRSGLPESVKLPFLDRTGVADGFMHVTMMNTRYEDTSPEFGVLNTRAWATQEWLLSRRILFYTKGGLVWSCKLFTQRETGQSFHTVARNPKWKFIVEKYSARNLTVPTDRLVALEGLRTELQKKSRDEYVFGLWKACLPDQLFWYVLRKAERGKSAFSKPTWSWISTPHAVRFLNILKARNVCEGITFAEGILSVTAFMRAVPTVKSPALRPMKPGGPVDEDLTLERYETFMDDARRSLPPDMTCSLMSDGGEEVGWAFLDEAEVPQCPTYALALMAKDTSKADLRRWNAAVNAPVGRTWREEWALLLRRIDEDQDVYSRIGVGKIFWRSWFRDATLQRIRIA